MRRCRKAPTRQQVECGVATEVRLKVAERCSIHLGKARHSAVLLKHVRSKQLRVQLELVAGNVIKITERGGRGRGALDSLANNRVGGISGFAANQLLKSVLRAMRSADI
jgi:hypothetical protein